MISLAVISRKEDEAQLLTLIASVKGHVDEIVVLDTTKKGTMTPIEGVIFKKFSWTNDFAAARNASFEATTGDYIIWADSDDTIEGAAKIRDTIVTKMEQKGISWLVLPYDYARDEYGNTTVLHHQPRITKRGTGVWKGMVHEAYVQKEAVLVDKVTDIFIKHHTDLKHSVESSARNLEILLAEYERDGEAIEARSMYYLANTLFGLGNYEEAARFYHMHTKSSGWDEEKYFSLCKMYECSAKLGDHAMGSNPLLAAIKLKPQWNLAYYKMGECYTSQEKWKEGKEWFRTGFSKQKPETMLPLNELDFWLIPYGIYAEACLYTMDIGEAVTFAEKLNSIAPKNPLVIELLKTVQEAYKLEDFVESFVTVTNAVADSNRVSAAKLFDLIPADLDDDIRIQQLKAYYATPTTWEDKSIAIYCGKSIEPWAFPSKFKGIGGSESAVIYLSEQLVKLGWKVVVYNRCGDMKGEYNGVVYRPYYHFNPKDRFNVLISWRNPSVFLAKIKAKKKALWLHDIAYADYFNATIFKNLDTVIFLSKWHRTNLPNLDEKKVFITNNGVDPKRFVGLPEKRPNSLFWGSSYDRGLLPFIKNILPLIKLQIPEVSLDVAYGWQNIEKELHLLPHLQQLHDELKPMLENTAGITHHGRLPHRKLAELMGSCMVYPYASEFGETNNMTSQECQTAGCYVVTTSESGGTPERVLFGSVVETNKIYTDKKSQVAFADAVVKALKEAHTAVDLSAFTWETTANQWNKELFNEN